MGTKFKQLTEEQQQFIYKYAGVLELKVLAKRLKCKPAKIQRWAYTHGLSLKVVKK